MSMNSPTGGSKKPEGADGGARFTAALLFLSLVQFFTQVGAISRIAKSAKTSKTDNFVNYSCQNPAIYSPFTLLRTGAFKRNILGRGAP